MWSKERMGREPLRQLPGKCNSDIVWTMVVKADQLEVVRPGGKGAGEEGVEVWVWAYDFVNASSPSAR